jgi:DNA modification methylase
MKKVKVLNQAHGNGWSFYNGDAIELIQGLPSNSIHYSCFSPPFSNLFQYNNSERDLGNSRNDDEFYEHYKFLASEQYRTLKSGRLMSVHCMQIPATKERDGYIGLKDFRGDLIRLYQQAGFIYHSEVCIHKCPVVQMQRTKSIGLLHKQLTKDSSMSRQGLPDYLVTFRKPGVNDEPIAGELTEYFGVDTPAPTDKSKQSVSIWQRLADPVWFDIDQSDTLNGERGKRDARDEADESHICPLQLGVIRRALQLWTNPGDIVFSPFGGIGSEPYVALEMGRRAIGFELKESYYRQAVKNLKSVAGDEVQQLSLLAV